MNSFRSKIPSNINGKILNENKSFKKIVPKLNLSILNKSNIVLTEKDEKENMNPDKHM